MSKAAELAALIGSQTALSNRNLIINGAMQVNQRGAATGITSSGYHGPDRMRIGPSSHGTYSVSQSTDAPEGFSTSYKVDCTTADTSLAAGAIVTVDQRIEAQNLQQLSFGSSDAKSVTLSFYVKSNLTGVYALNIFSNDAGRTNTLNYTINSADTWQKVELTFVGDTAGSGIANDNGRGLDISWGLAAGSTYTGGSTTGWNVYSSNVTSYMRGQAVDIGSSTSNEWLITGIQLEIGDVATAFEHEDIGTTFAKCQRYFQDYSGVTGTTLYINGTNEPSSEVANSRLLPVVMRTSPSVLNSTTTSGSVGGVGANENQLKYFTASGHSSGGLNIGFQLDAEL
jgi:hypothetical protein